MGQSQSAFRASLGDMTGKVAVVTGANTGIGKETARYLAGQGARVIVACRSVEKGEAAAADIRSGGVRGSVEVMQVDLSDLASVERFAAAVAAKVEALDVLVNNAGINTFGTEPVTRDGIEACWEVNYLAHYLLTERLSPLLQRSRDGRLVNLGSLMHRFSSRQLMEGARRRAAGSYNNSKLAMVMHARAMARRMPAVKCVAVNPGAVNSDIWRALDQSWAGPAARFLFRLVFLTNEQGARCSAYAAAGPRVATGSYLAPYWVPSVLPGPLRVLFEAVGPAFAPAPLEPAPEAMDDALCDELLRHSEELCREALRGDGARGGAR